MPDLAASTPVNDTKEQMPTMGFLDHLEELRKRIVYSIIAIAIGFFACWGYAGNIYSVMQRPIMDALHATVFPPNSSTSIPPSLLISI